MVRTIILGLSVILLTACRSFNPAAPTPGSEGSPLVHTKPCIQAGFRAGVSQEDLNQIKDLGFKVVRMDVQGLDGPSTNRIINEVQGSGLEGLYVVTNADQLRDLPSGLMYELRNEPDLEGPAPSEYRVLMFEAAEVARMKDQILYVGVVSNLNDRGFDYLKALLPFPDNVKVSIHRYGDGTFTNPHRGFDSRHSEVKWLKDVIGARTFGVSEFGYPTDDLGESTQAYRTQQEFEFWNTKSDFTCLYQLNDGPLKNETYGIRRYPDKSLKPNSQIIKNIT